MAAAALLTPLFLWPLLCAPARELPAPIDATLNTFILARGMHNLEHWPWRLADSGTFHPLTTGMALSELLYGLSAPGLLFKWLGAPPVLCFNLLLWLTFPLMAGAGYSFYRQFDCPPAACWLGGFLLAFAPFRWTECSRIQLETGYFLVFGLAAAFKAAQRRAWRWHALWGAALAVLAATCWYLAFYLALLLPPVLAANLIRNPSRRQCLGLILGGGIATAGILIAAAPYRETARNIEGFERSLAACRMGSADIVSFFSPAGEKVYRQPLVTVRDHIGKWFRAVLPASWTRGSAKPAPLFPGILTTLLAMTVISGKLPGRQRPLRRWALLWIACFAVLALGPYLRAGGVASPLSLPYGWLFNVFPGFRAMRTPYRMGMVVQFAAVTLAVLGASRLVRYLRGKPLAASAVTFVCLALLAGDFWHGELRRTTLPLPDEIPAVYQWLAQQHTNGVVLELPFKTASNPAAPQSVTSGKWTSGPVSQIYPIAALYQYYALTHGHRLVNGHSGFDPPGQLELDKALQLFPAPESLPALAAAAPDYVVVHWDMLPGFDQLSPSGKQPIPSGLELVAEFGQDTIYRRTAR